MSRWFVLGLVVASFSIFTTAIDRLHAQEAKEEIKKEKESGGYMPQGWAQLELTSAQKEKIRELLLTAREKISAGEKKIKVVRSEAKKQIDAAEKELEVTRKKLREEMKAVLTPAQQEQVKAIEEAERKLSELRRGGAKASAKTDKEAISAEEPKEK